MAILFQPPLPPQYSRLSEPEMAERIRAHKKAFGDQLVILGHHYQQDEIMQFADLTGDSLKLSQLAAEQKNARYVVFCGVHFMAESADILTDDDVAVILPDLSAGCSMADMADIDQVEDAWDRLTRATGAKLIPITPPVSRHSAGGTTGAAARAATPARCSNGPWLGATRSCSHPISTWAGTRLMPWATRSKA